MLNVKRVGFHLEYNEITKIVARTIYIL